MRLSTITWTAFFIIAIYWLVQLSGAYYRAISAYYDVKHSQTAYVLYGK